MTSSSWLRTAAVAVMTPVLTSDPAYLGQYAYALRVVASAADRCDKPVYAAHIRSKSYHMRTLAR